MQINKYLLALLVLSVSALNAMIGRQNIPIPNFDIVYKQSPQEQVETFRNYIKKAWNIPALYVAVDKWSYEDPYFAALARKNKTLVLQRELKLLHDIENNVRDLLSTDAIEQMKKLGKYMERISQSEENKRINLVLEEKPRDTQKRLQDLKDTLSPMLATYYTYFAPAKQVRAVEILLANGANPNAVVKAAGPALRYVVISIIEKMKKNDAKGLQEYINLLSELLQAGADPNIHPNTPAYTEQLAKIYTPEALQIVQTLLNYGAYITPELEKIAEKEKQGGSPELYNLLQHYKQRKSRKEIFHAYERGED